jgi:uncharacterized protein YicC (UPF0701 family)
MPSKHIASGKSLNKYLKLKINQLRSQLKQVDRLVNMCESQTFKKLLTTMSSFSKCLDDLVFEISKHFQYHHILDQNSEVYASLGHISANTIPVIIIL